MYCVEAIFQYRKGTAKHKEYVDSAQWLRKLTAFGASSATESLNQKVVKFELLFSAFLVEHNLSLSTVDHTAKLIRNLLPSSKIVKKYQCVRTKTTHMLTEAVGKQITSKLKEELLLTHWTDQRNMEPVMKMIKFLPVFVTYVDKYSRMVVASLLDMPRTNSCLTAHQMYDVGNEVREAFASDLDNYVT